MFYETFSWWGLLVVCVALGYSQQIGAYGRGRKSTKIENVSNLLIVIVFVVSFFISGVWGGVFLVLAFIVVNSTITKYIIKATFQKSIRYTPLDREEVQRQVMDEFMEKNKNVGDGFSIVDVEREVRRRLNIKD
ncbi:MAG: hypothetical protein WC831_01650 [Parcubacteria group bacterium]|jgi:multisubunit Na+/H+ antiporter MnhG subunit